MQLCLFTGHIALMNVTTELKNKALVNVVVKSNKVIRCFVGINKSLLLYISTYFNSWVTLKVSSPLNHSSQATVYGMMSASALMTRKLHYFFVAGH